jgi:ribulose-phosphate 3-epimerase
MHVADLVLIMTVNPGFGGQAYIPSMEEKIKNARKMIDKTGREIALEADGGIKADNIKKVIRAGADVIVMGTEIFHSTNYRAKIQEIRKKIGP